jgi:hypothetical protein
MTYKNLCTCAARSSQSEEDYAYLIHQSAKDYLTTSALARVFPDGAGPIHFQMFSRSLNTLSETLRRDIYDLRHPGLPVDEVKKSNRDLLAAQYSCVYWVNHLYHVEDQSSEHSNKLSDHEEMFSFLKRHFLHWIESLSLLHALGRNIVYQTASPRR